MRAGVIDANAPKEVAPGAYVCHAPAGWQVVARELAAALGGQGRPSPSRTGAAWQCGSALGGTLIDNSVYRSVTQAQGIVQGIIPGAPLRWSVGSNARQLLAYVGPPQLCPPLREKSAAGIVRHLPANADLLLEGIDYGYHECTPGEYPDAEHYDVSGFYYYMMSQLPSLRLTVTNERIIFDAMPPDEWERWREVLAGILPHKGLRNSLAGAAAGSTWKEGRERAVAYARVKGAAPAHKGDPFPTFQFDLPLLTGPFRAAGLLVVRTGYEKTLQTCRQNTTIYSNIDSVICLPPYKPSWERYGFTVRQDAKGNAHILGRGNWRVGTRKTLNYGSGQGTETPAPAAIMPPVQYGTWLKCQKE